MKKFVPLVALCIALSIPANSFAQTKTTAEILESIKLIQDKLKANAGLDTSINPEQYKEAERLEEEKIAEEKVNNEVSSISDESIVYDYSAVPSSRVSYEQPEKPIRAGIAFINDPALRLNYSRRFKIEGGSWKTQLDGYVQIADSNDYADINSRINFGDNIYFEKKEAAAIKATYALGGKTGLEISYSKQEHDGRLNVDGKVFDGITFNANAKLNVTNEWVDLALTRKLARTFNHEGRESSFINGIIGVKTNMFKAEIKDPKIIGISVPASADWDETIPVPYLGLNFGLPISNRVFAKSDLRYFECTYDDYDAQYRDFTVEAIYRINNSNRLDWFLNAGYRNAKYDVSGKGDAVLLKYKGPVFSLEAAF